MSEIIINSEIALQSAIGELRDTWAKHKFVRMILRAKKRSLDQNALAAVWYEQMAREDRQYDALGHKSYCKLVHGVPLLRAEDAEFRERYDSLIRARFSYEEKLELMRWFPITSLMSVDQLSRYLVAVRDDYERLGVFLKFPEDGKRRAA